MNIYQDSINALIAVLKQKCEELKVSDIVISPGRFYIREYIRKNSKIVFPYVSVTLRGVSQNNEQGNRYSQKNQGYDTIRSTNSTNWTVTPVIATFGVFFISNSYKDLLNFSQFWIHETGDLNFSLEHELSQTKLKCRTSVNKDITFPEIAIEEVGELFVLETDMTLYTWVGNSKETPLIGIKNVENSGEIIKSEIILEASSKDGSKLKISLNLKPL